MFSTIASVRFHFLESHYGFQRIPVDDRCVLYLKGDSNIRFSHSRFDEVSMTIGQTGHGTNFSPDLLVALIDPAKGAAIKEQIVSRPDRIDLALAEFEAILRTYGRRVLDSNLTVYTELKALSDAQSGDHAAQAIRYRAEEAFAAKDFRSALGDYRSLGGRRTALDSKRLEMCERHIREG